MKQKILKLQRWLSHLNIPKNKQMSFQSIRAFVILFSMLTIGIYQQANAQTVNVSINQKSTQADPTSASSVVFRAVFNTPINTSTFSTADISSIGSTASGVVINYVTEISPFDGTTFEIGATASSSGSIVLSIPAAIKGYTGPVAWGIGETPVGYLSVNANDDIYVSCIDPFNSIQQSTNAGIYKIPSTGNTTSISPIIVPYSNANLLGTFQPQSPTAVNNNDELYFLNPSLGSYQIIKKNLLSTYDTIATLPTGAYISMLSFDKLGNLYGAGVGNNLYKISSGGTVTTIPLGAPALSMEIDSSSNVFLCVGTGSTNTLKKISSTGVVTTITNISSFGFCIDESGNVYLPSNGFNNNPIKKISTTGVITNITGAIGIPFYIDTSGNLIYINQQNGVGFVLNELYQMSSSGIPTKLTTGYPSFSSSGITNNTIRRIVRNSNNDIFTSYNVLINTGFEGGIWVKKMAYGSYVSGITTVGGIGNETSTSSDNSVTIVKDVQSPFVTINQHLSQIDPTATSPITFTALFNEPIQPATFTASDISTLGSTATGVSVNTVTEVAPMDGTTFEVSMNATGTGTVVVSILESPKTIIATLGIQSIKMVKDNAGNSYVLNYGSNNITKIDVNGVASIFATTGTNPIDIAIDALGNLYTANSVSNNVSKITPAGVSSILGTTDAGPQSVVLDVSGNVYTCNSGGNSVTKITPSGTSSVFATVTSPTRMIIDASGDLFVTTFTSVVKITASGVSSTFANITGQTAIVADASGNLYLSGGTNLLKVSSTGSVSTFATAPTYCNTIALDNSGSVYVASPVTNTIYKYASTGVYTSSILLGFSTYNLSIDTNNNIYATDITEGALLKVNQNSTTEILDVNDNGSYASTSTDNTVTLTSGGAVGTSLTVSACNLYTWTNNGVTYNTSGTYTYNNGSSFDTLNLTITSNTTLALATANNAASIAGNACESKAQTTGSLLYNDASCRRIVNINGSSTMGNVTACVNGVSTNSLPVLANAQTFGKRWFSINPTVAGTGDVTFYFTHNDFIVHNLTNGTLDMPLTMSNSDPNIGNMKIAQIQNGLLSTTVNYPATLNWNSTNNYWEATISNVNILPNSQYYFYGEPNCTLLVNGASITSSNVTATTAHVTWDSVSSATAYIVRWRKTSPIGPWVSAQTTATFRTLTGLTPLTSYEIQVRTVCGTGWGLSSTSGGNFTTTAQLPACSTPTGLASANITGTSATLNWGASQNVNSYYVRWRPTSGGNWSAAYTTATNRVLTGLSSATQYEAQVMLFCNNTTTSTSAWSAPITFTTLTVAAPVICNIPMGLAVSAITPTSALATWTAAVNATSYQVKWSVQGSGIWSSAFTTNVSRLLTPLMPNTMYEMNVKSYCTGSSNSSKEGSSVLFSTGISSKPSVQNTIDNNRVNIYPNPTEGILNIDISDVEEGNVSIKLMDLSGRLIKEIQTNSLKNIQLDINNLSNGIYVLQIRKEEQIMLTQKVEKR